MARILESGLAEMQRGEMFRNFVTQASGRFDQLGTPEAMQIAQMIRENPQGATQYVSQFGGWENVYNRAQANAGRAALADAVSQLQAGAQGQGQGLTQQQVLQQILPVVLRYGVGGDLLDQIATAFGRPNPKVNIGAAEPKDFTPESLAAYERTGDRSVLRPVVREAAPSRPDFTAPSWAQYHQTGDSSVLVPLPPRYAPPAPDRTPNTTRYREEVSMARLTPPAQRTPKQQKMIEEANKADIVSALLQGLVPNVGASSETPRPTPESPDETRARLRRENAE